MQHGSGLVQSPHAQPQPQQAPPAFGFVGGPPAALVHTSSVRGCPLLIEGLQPLPVQCHWAAQSASLGAPVPDGLQNLQLFPLALVHSQFCVTCGM